MFYESRRHLRNCPLWWLAPIILLEFIINEDIERTIILSTLLLITVFQWVRNDAFYYFTNEVLVAKGFFGFKKIPLTTINKIQVKKNKFLKKNKKLEYYQIYYDKKKIIVTPLDMDGFLSTLKEKTGVKLS